MSQVEMKSAYSIIPFLEIIISPKLLQLFCLCYTINVGHQISAGQIKNGKQYTVEIKGEKQNFNVVGIPILSPKYCHNFFSDQYFHSNQQGVVSPFFHLSANCTASVVYQILPIFKKHNNSNNYNNNNSQQNLSAQKYFKGLLC